MASHSGFVHRWPHLLAATWLWLGLAVLPAGAAAGQQVASTERVVRSAAVTSTTAVITIDGALDEEAWSSAPTIGDLIQRQPSPGQAPTERTQVTLLYDRDNLYIGVVAYDAEPESVIGTQMARDGSVSSDDRIEILLYVGVIFTDGHPARGQSGQTYGADIRLATSRFLGRSRNLIVDAYGVRSVNEGRSDKDWSYGFSAHYPNDVFQAQATLREVQDGFTPALGFVQRDNVRLLRLAGSYNPRPKRFLNILQMNHDVFYTRFTRLDNGQVESQDLYITWWDWHFKSGDNLHSILDVNPAYERVFETFEIAPGVVLPRGEYRFTRFRSNLFTTAAKRRLSGGVTVTFGNYWSGKAEQVTTTLTYKLPPKLTMTFNTNQTFARLPEGHFTARIVTSTVNYTASPLLLFSNLIQFDNRSRNLGWQGRVRWTLQPGNDLFVAINQGWIREEAEDRSLRFQAEDSKISAKLQYSFRF